MQQLAPTIVAISWERIGDEITRILTEGGAQRGFQLLESSGLVRTEKIGRVRSVALQRETLRGAEQWFTAHRARWETRFDRLGALLAEPEGDSRTTKKKNSSNRRNRRAT